MEFTNVNSSDLASDDYDITVIGENLTLSLLICSITNLTSVFIYWTYLLYTSINLATTWENLFPHFILLGQFLGSSSSLVNVVIDHSSTYFCLVTLLVPISYTLIYSTLMVRLVYIYSLHKDMYRLPTIYQTLLLFFCVMVQVSVSIQSFLLTQLTVCPSHTSIYSSPFTDMVSLSYSLFLLMSITCFSTMQRRRREQRQEAWSIWIFSILSVTLWVAWMAIALIFDEHYRVIKGK